MGKENVSKGFRVVKAGNAGREKSSKPKPKSKQSRIAAFWGEGKAGEKFSKPKQTLITSLLSKD